MLIFKLDLSILVMFHFWSSFKLKGIFYKLTRIIFIMRYPVEVFFTFTTKCNLKCKHCYSNSMAGGKTTEVINILKILKKIRPLRIIVSGGEPFIDFDKLLNFLKNYKKKYKIDSYVVIATNATIFDEKKLRKIKPYVDRMQISLDTLSEEKFIRLRGVNFLNKTIEGIKLAKKLGFDIQIAFSIFRDNLEEVEGIINFCEKNKIDKINVLRQRPLGRSKPDVSPKEVKETYEKFLRLSNDKKIKIIIHDPIANILGIESECTAAKESVAVDIEGKFKPCPLFSYSISGKFEDIWYKNEFFNKIREDINECKDCEVKHCNGGCRACSWNLYKKLKKDPWCMKGVSQRLKDDNRSSCAFRT